MKYRWIMRPLEQQDVVARLQQLLNNLHPALARTLALRGIDSFEAARLFFRPNHTHLHDPFLMQDMAAAADRVAAAVLKGERILVYGDYDVDGTTSTALMTSFLRGLGAEVDFFIPDRVEDGYGLGETGIDYAATQGAGLIIALDCGITAHEEARYARSRGLDLIICDHHTPESTYPDALAILNPKRPDCSYPFKELSGCGVGFKLAQAVLSRLGRPAEEVYAYLDLVALSIASDIVPLYGENRVLMSEGLTRLRTHARVGIEMLAEVARLDLKTCNSQGIVFALGPRINAAGRMGDAQRAVDLMLEQDPARAYERALQLEALNQQRRDLDQETLTEACHLADRQLNARMRHSVVLYRPEWHLGVIGIVASRLVERFYRPAIMMCAVGGQVKGSARSINGINVYQALKACEDVLTTFGGHDYAAGLSLPEENVPLFQRRFDEAVRASSTPELLLPEIEIDASLDLDDIDPRFWAVLKQFAPHGPHNDTPVFQAGGLEVAGPPRTVGRQGEHLKFAVRQHGSASTPMEVIGFGQASNMSLLRESQAQGRPVELLFSLQENTWNGNTSLQLRARDLRLEAG